MNDEQLMHLFWSRVRKTDGCWLWEGGKRAGGGKSPGFAYGYFSRGARGSSVPAHRHSWELANGPIPDGLVVCHRCDVPLCVRPDHLFLGTVAENIRDMHAKGRAHFQRNPDSHPRGDAHGARLHPESVRRGERAPKARLTADQVVEMRQRRAAGETLHALAEAYGVTISAVNMACIGRSWSHVPGAIPASGYARGDRHYTRLRPQG